MILINLPQQYNENRFHFETLNTNTKPSHIDSIDTNTREYLLFYYLCSFCIIDDIILTSLCLRLYGSLGNDPVVGSLVMWVVWKHEVNVLIPDWNGLHSPHKSIYTTTQNH